MAHRRLFKQRQKQRITLRQILLTTVILVTLIGGGAATLLFLHVEEESSAFTLNDMVVTKIDVLQPQEKVYKGSSNTVILHVVINTTGNNTPLVLKNMMFSARGTTRPWREHISTARLWYTGTNPDFHISDGVGVSVDLSKSSEENLIFTGNRTLACGKNHFWLSYDLNPNSESRGVEVDGELISCKIGGLEYRPDINSPSGVIPVHDNESWFAYRDGDLADLRIWNSKRDGTGNSPENLNDTTAVYIILAGRSLSNDLGIKISDILIEGGARLYSTGPLRSRQVTVKANGILRFDSEERIKDLPARIQLEPNSTFVHNNGGILPPTLSMARASNLWLLREPKRSFMSGKFQPGNVIVGFTTEVAYNIGEIGSTINGDLIISNKSDKSFIYYAGPDTLTIQGNLQVNDGFFGASYGDFMNIIQIHESLICTNGKFHNQVTSDRKGTAEILVGKDVVISDCDFRLSDERSNPATIRLIAGSTHIWRQNGPVASPGNVILEPRGILSLSGKTFGPLNGTCGLRVMKNSEINCNTAIVTGIGEFLLDDFAKITIAHPEGLNSVVNAGNIQTGQRVFSQKAIYEFTGSAAIQRTGVFNTLDDECVTGQLIINLANPNGILVLDKNIRVTDRLLKKSGNVVQNNYEMITGGQESVSLH
jgi:hypothetical protein